jgi:hypothetical protein
MTRLAGRCSAALLIIGAAAVLEAQQPRLLTLGMVRGDSLTSRDPVTRQRRAPYHVWTFEGRRGEHIAIDMTSSDFDAYLMLRDADGGAVASDDDGGEGNNARIRTVLPRDGRYRIVATAFATEGRGQYALVLTGWESPPGPPPGVSGTLHPGETKEGVLEPGDSIGVDGPYEDRWTFDAPAGSRMRIELRSDDFNAYLIVLGPDGRVVASDDDGLEAGQNHAAVSVRSRGGGSYTALASSFGESPLTGAYRISLLPDSGTFADPGAGASIAAGETRDGRLEDGDETGSRGYQDNWTFSGRAGQIIRIDVTSRQFDPYVRLLRDGMPLDSNDDGGEGTNARLSVALPATGTYTAVVSSFTENRAGGRYQIALALTTAPAGAGQIARITPGQRVSGRLEEGDRGRGDGAFEDWFEFEGRSGQVVSIEMRASEFDAYLELRDARGEVVSENDDGLGEGRDAFIMTALPANGRYRIVARSYGESSRGLYDLSFAMAGPAAAAGRAGELRPGDLVVGRLEYGDSVVGDSTYADVYTFRADRTGDIVIELSSSDFDAYLILRDAQGRTLATDDDGGTGSTNSRIVARVTAGQTYRILANSFGAERASGSYRITLRWST